MNMTPSAVGARRASHAARRGGLLLTTSDLGAGRGPALLRLLASVEAAARAESVPVSHYVLLQGAPAGPPPSVLAFAGTCTRLLSIRGRLSLSRARNLLLARARDDGALGAALWLAFPDDDAWYPACLLAEVDALFAARAGLALATCRYGAHPVALRPGTAGHAFRAARGTGELIRAISSNTLMLRAAVAEAVGGFDERLGVGAPISGGEDLDYALRALARGAGQAVLSEQALVGHRDRLPWVRSQYFAGSLFALARAARARPSLAPQVLRKLMVGVSLLALRELGVADLGRAVRTGLSGWRTPLPEISEETPHVTRS